ncbi:MAG: bifunctional diaminohydroxyphosphoribosylaminopyrimidine deaminase/5-amino-6-(5-phosphoribosylamino)uracil reductase RibD [Tepidisphaeraceae bacterium]
MPTLAPELDEQMMRRAIRLAMNGRGGVEPNPMVGCVIVKDSRAIGEGFHAQYGGPHAEPTALAACTESPAGATAYVTLEPCCHTNKKTPPCAPRLIEAKIARVVVGCLDPNPDVNGKGISMLRNAGIEVVGPVLEPSAKQLIAPFLAGVQHRRPYVTMKWAQSADGKVAGHMGRAVRITNEPSDPVVHRLRARCDAIIVGTNTVLNDDPLLTARGVETVRRLTRVVLSNSLKIAPKSRLVATAREHPLIIYSSESSARMNETTVDALRGAGAEVVTLPEHDGRFSFADVLHDLHARKVVHALVEPGPTLTRYMFARGQADRVWVFRSPKVIGESDAPAAPDVSYPQTIRIDVADDTLSEYLNPQSSVFFSAEPSADAVLVKEGRA